MARYAKGFIVDIPAIIRIIQVIRRDSCQHFVIRLFTLLLPPPDTASQEFGHVFALIIGPVQVAKELLAGGFTGKEDAVDIGAEILMFLQTGRWWPVRVGSVGPVRVSAAAVVPEWPRHLTNLP